MAYIKQSAIVLRKKTLRQGNRWYTLLCKENGKVDVMARSAASSASKLAGHLEPGVESEVMLAPGKAIVHLAGAKTIQSYKYINLDLDSAILKMAALSATNNLIFNSEESENAFELLSNFLSDLNNQKLQVWQKQRLFDLFIINLLAVAGFEPNLSLGHKAKHFSFHRASLIGGDLLDEWAVDLVLEPSQYRVNVDKNLIKLFEFMLSKKISWSEKRDWLVRVKRGETSFDNLHKLINRYYFYQIDREVVDVSQIMNYK